MTWVLRLLASLAALSAVIWLVDPATLGPHLRGADMRWMALAVAVLGAQVVVSALRWQVTAQALGVRLPTLWAICEYHLSVLGNTVLPGGVLGDVGRVARMRAHGGWRLAVGSVVIERLAGQVALACAAMLGVGWWALTQLGAAAVPVISLGVAVTVALVWGGVRFLPDAVRRAVSAAWFAPQFALRQLGYTAVILCCNLGGVWAAAQAVGVQLGLGAALFVIPLTLLAMLLPVSVNGWGLREGAALLLWPLVGVAGPQAVAASISFGLAALGAAMLAIVPWTVQLVLRDRPMPAMASDRK
ncbi:lysylphosphatidylglycerol synthase transmembrane domain-containing protein [Roseinatronobacter sp. S2]|uniref:lysylphosphatidylglycerol synthase transmembrane domain-containing protein n=1 Tax=Roseinatronobacter sp. S2 TaxID=3035471 RepID=UPI00241079F6|nr:lysylphosphatidylglycerol synthase transmembrane domain-containing protein [Roseinatronobacter sp. S2]WFE75707.1 lysylphosphatidylglycerol synthase transmembrane domain-containing protein [Roseinatronobacter sp. S2]